MGRCGEMRGDAGRCGEIRRESIRHLGARRQQRRSVARGEVGVSGGEGEVPRDVEVAPLPKGGKARESGRYGEMLATFHEASRLLHCVSACRSRVPSSPVSRPPIPRSCPVRACGCSSPSSLSSYCLASGMCMRTARRRSPERVAPTVRSTVRRHQHGEAGGRRGAERLQSTA